MSVCLRVCLCGDCEVCEIPAHTHQNQGLNSCKTLRNYTATFQNYSRAERTLLDDCTSDWLYAHHKLIFIINVHRGITLARWRAMKQVSFPRSEQATERKYIFLVWDWFYSSSIYILFILREFLIGDTHNGISLMQISIHIQTHTPQCVQMFVYVIYICIWYLSKSYMQSWSFLHLISGKEILSDFLVHYMFIL